MDPAETSMTGLSRDSGIVTSPVGKPTDPRAPHANKSVVSVDDAGGVVDDAVGDVGAADSPSPKDRSV